ncbi:SufD family Fe-S cluster assembly protein [Leptospira idonii]|uniref:SufD family Fe-S cluster assembly protein n=1 Tax=Leptospira idonii TaxID=1193500 RepID=A0A4R9M0N9_9LEPT|nr:SufD family Fe-S cluster assembly protein [Leptospira idonii]
MDQGLVASFREKAKSLLGTLSFPKGDEEVWRKFPLNQFHFPELSSEPLTSSVEVKDSIFASEIVSSKASEIFDELLESCKSDFFALYGLVHAKEYYFYSLGGQDGKDEVEDWNFHFKGEGSVSSVFLLHVPKNKKVRLTENYSSSTVSDKLHLFTSVSFYDLEDASCLDLVLTEDYDPDLYHFRSVFSRQAKDSKLSLYSFPLGGFRGKTFYFPKLSGKGSELNLSAVTALNQREWNDVEALVTHHADHTTSKLSYKTIVTDKSHHIFTGNLHIPPNLKKVVAHQESHNLSLDKKARAEANPKLEVFSEDVSCTHGATVGDIDEEQLFYLLSRGLSPEDAKSLLVSAFYGKAIAELPFPDSLKETLETRIHSKISGRKIG